MGSLIDKSLYLEKKIVEIVDKINRETNITVVLHQKQGDNLEISIEVKLPNSKNSHCLSGVKLDCTPKSILFLQLMLNDLSQILEIGGVDDDTTGDQESLPDMRRPELQC